MQLKNYFTILELPSSASAAEIKKAYRRLAHQYHPDKKNNNPYASSQFVVIKEAYETLSNPVKKEYYLQQCWYAQCMNKKIRQEIITPVTVLQQLLELNRYISKLDVYRMYHEGLFGHINTILSDETICKLNSFNEPAINNEIILITLRSAHVFPYRYIAPLTERLKKITPHDEAINKKIAWFIRHHQHTNYWEKRKIWIMLVIVLLVCLVIFFSANQPIL